ncbi:MAG: hypothetical protein K2L94_03335 [Alphaproteobacteria bacterium]|nr:hypothetical protein [Alphaproteobacteria bacterium]
MTACGAQWRDLTAIGVVVGPGSFTGIRLGIAHAKGLAMELGIPIVPINAIIRKCFTIMSRTTHY